MGDRGIQIQESAVGSAIVSGDGNVVNVIYQVIQQSILETVGTATRLGPNPYRGLAAFTEKDSDRYFGREAQIDRLWEEFQTLVERSVGPRLLTVLGPSGCGKSSLVRAGLIPALAQRPLLGKSRMRVAVLVPGEHPLEALSDVLAKAVTEDPMPVTKSREFADELNILSASGEYDGLRRITALMPEIRDSPLVVLVDQFEEVYTNEPRGTTPEEQGRREQFIQDRTAFIENLLCAAKDSSGNLSVILTLRSDFLGETQRHPDLNQAISHQEVIVPAMTAAELARAIAEPAKQAGYPFEDGLVDCMVRDMAGQEGALPLLQFALTKLWEELSQESPGGRSPLQVYLDIGGIAGAVADRADKIFDGLKDADGSKVDRQAIAQRIFLKDADGSEVDRQAIAQRIFLSLVQPGGENNQVTRRRVRVKDLVTSKFSLEQVRAVIHEFSKENARLITLSTVEGEVTAEVTHEALFKTWQRFKDWISDRWDDIRLQQRLEAAATYWDEQGRPAGLLWRSPDLDLLRTFIKTHAANLTQRCLDFFHASDRAEQREQRLKRLGIAGLAAGLVLTTTLTGFAGYQVRRAERRQIEIYEAEAKSLAETDPLGSMVSGLAAISLGQNPLVKLPRLGGEGLVSPGVLDLGNRYARFDRVAGSHQGVVNSVALSADGNTLVSGGSDGTVRLWDRQGQPIAVPFQGHQGGVNSVALSADGSIVVSGGSDGTVRLWNRQGQPIAAPFQGHQGEVISVALSADGSTIVSGGSDRTVRLWDRQGQPITAPFQGYEGEVISVAISADGNIIVSGSYDGTVRLWNRQGQAIGVPFQGHEGVVNSVALSADGSTIVSGGYDGTVRLWDHQGQAIGVPFQGHEGVVSSLGTVQLWDRPGQAIGAPFQSYEGVVNSVALSADGNTIVSGGYDGTVRLWDRQGQPIAAPFQGHQGVVNSVALSTDGSTIVSGGYDGTVRLWDGQGQPIGELFHSYEDGVSSVAFSPDGETLVSGGGDMVRLWNRQQGQPIGEQFRVHEGWVSSVAFSSDGETLVSGSLDGTVRLWPVWLAEQGWVNYTCNRIRPYLVAHSETDEPARLARRTCERWAWR
ncbi:MAG: NACHT and WD repeat domain-containing protein [Nodosilinea sp.]